MPSKFPRKYFWGILAPLIVLCYINSLHADWHFDDIPRILLSPAIHLNKLSIESLQGTFYSLWEAPAEIYRPVACLTLGLNWFFGQDNVVGYHIFNLFIHIMTGYLLLCTLLLLHETPALQHIPREVTHKISFMTTLLWAVHPIHTQAVTYIVQRMCLMAAFFTILGIFLYLKYRYTNNARSRLVILILLIFSYALALGSKENGILLPASLTLIELIFFYKPIGWRRHSSIILSVCLTSVLLFIFAVTFTDYWEHISYTNSYDGRSFSIKERLLTETRILFFYLSQLFYPLSHRFSLAHDIQLSQSLIFPLSTLFSFLGILALLSIATIKHTRCPIFSFAILFFFLNHIVESTIISLELIFEHRNYLPSLFIFWPIATLLYVTIPSWFHPEITWNRIRTTAVLILALSLCQVTITRNQIWQTDESLWRDAHSKAPSTARPVYYLGKLAEQEGDLYQALQYLNQALALQDASETSFRTHVHIDIGDLYSRMGQVDAAIHNYEISLGYTPNSPLPMYQLALAHYKLRNLETAEKYLRQMITESKAAEKTHALLGKILLESGRPLEALGELAKSLQFKQLPEASIDFALCLSTLERDKEAEQVLSQPIMQDASVRLSADLLHLTLLGKQKIIPIRTELDLLLAHYPLPAIHSTLQYFLRCGIPKQPIQHIGVMLADILTQRDP